MKLRRNLQPEEIDSLRSGVLYIPHQLLEAIPTISGRCFFIRPSNPLDDPVTSISSASSTFAMNPNQQYQAPKLNHSWPQGSEVYQAIDANLVKIQERQAYSTRPLDKLATCTLDHITDQEMRKEIFQLIHLTRSQLSMTARQIQEMRLDNYADAIGAKPELVSENGTSPSNDAVVTKTTPASGPTASTSLQGSSYSSPSGIMKSINPLNIPEIKLEIGRYLKNSTLARCALVCHDWNQSFTPLLYSFVELTEKPGANPPVEALRRHETLIKSMSVVMDKLDPVYSHLLLPNLKTLDLDLSLPSNTIEPMIRNNTGIVFLKLSGIPINDRIMMWKSVARLPHLEELTIQNQSVYDKEALWGACRRLKKLTFIHSKVERLLDSTNTGTPLEQTADFDLLRDLTISGCRFYISAELMLITKCQNLERLEWKIDRHTTGADEATLYAQGFIKNLASRKWPNMKSLAINFPRNKDAVFAELIRAFDNRTLEKLDVSTTKFGGLAFNALKNHFLTLQVLNILNCPNLTSANILEILVSCPHLQSLSAERIYAQYLDPNQEWPCRKTLQSLSIEFELAQEPSPGESSVTTAMGKTPRELNETVFACLGQLRELKHLTIGYPEYFDFRRTRTPAVLRLGIQLSKGLKKLAGLKRLNHFSMGALTGSLGAKEVGWMMNNWPNLVVLEGLSDKTTEIPRQRVAKRKGITVK
ncbi:hypothetical protein BGZ79_002373 [Entomortierella chlamydospora]|nr:hypothetical protein BGZ79_002373 [Entomortierella chlamydospora]